MANLSRLWSNILRIYKFAFIVITRSDSNKVKPAKRCFTLRVRQVSCKPSETKQNQRNVASKSQVFMKISETQGGLVRHFLHGVAKQSKTRKPLFVKQKCFCEIVKNCSAK